MKIQRFISAAGLTIATAMFSCTPDIIEIGQDNQQIACTTDAECGEGRTCGEGACQTSCVTDAECPSGLSCVSGECVDGAASGACVADADCPSGLSCVSGECVECIADADCPSALSCVSGECVECIADADCPSALSCVSGACVECIADADCPGDDLCSRNGFCSDGAGFCTIDADCPLRGQICTEGVCEGPGVQVCGPEYPEPEYGGCPENYVCIGETCKSTQPPVDTACVTDADCPLFCGKSGVCSNGINSCTTEADCPVDGQSCEGGRCTRPGA
ncbi:hypothetical protein [Sorangium sp. So ce1153]|uniref:hypothetical protein n=1 Tax=Sorangium sp. So ce1153 TaxID=3133333 RepID=UPI003F5E561C